MQPADAAPQKPAAPASRWRAVMFMLLGGVCFGYSLAVVPVYLTYDAVNEDCEGFTGEEGCTSGSFRFCTWLANQSKCVFADYATVNCTAGHGSVEACEAVTDADGDAACTYDYEDDVCERAYGLTALQAGIFASANVLGGFFGAPVANLVSRRFGFRGAGITLGLLAVIPTVVASVARVVEQYWVLVAARVVMGVMGWGACFLAPLYPSHTLDTAQARTVSSGYQVAVDLGLLLGALYGIAAEPRDLAADASIELRIHVLHGVQVLLGLAWIVYSCCVPESPYYSKETGLRPVGEEAAPGAQAVADAGATSAAEPTKAPPRSGRFAAKLYAVAFCVSSALQMTGVGPFVAFAPQIAAEVGISPLLGNLIVSALFVLGAIIGPFVASRFDQKRLYVLGSVSTSLGCGLLCIAVLGAQGSDAARYALSVAGIVIFSIGFNALSGTLFFVWAQRIFPPDMVQPGSSFANTAASVEQMLNTLLFPIAIVAISGGIAGDQRVGTGAVFAIYCALGLVFAVLVGMFMRPYAEEPAVPVAASHTASPIVPQPAGPGMQAAGAGVAPSAGGANEEYTQYAV